MTKQKNLTRTCTACGIEKPLSAFLQITGTHGTNYGNICSACRSMGVKEKPAESTREDERSSTSSEMRIGAKQRLEIEKEQKREKQDIQRKHIEEANKREKTSTEQSDRTELKEKSEKTHREFFIEDKKKQGFLNYQSKKPSSVQTQSIIGQKKEDKTATSPFLIQEFEKEKEREKQRLIEELTQNESQKQEQQKTTVDLTSPVIDQQHNVISRDNPIFKQFQAWLGSAPIGKSASQLYRTSSPVKPIQETSSKSPQIETETPKEFIEKTWGASSRKR